MFIHLRSHSSYSLLSGALRIEQMAQLCHLFSMPALALTDYGNLFGALEFSETLSEQGLQPIIGCCLPVHLDTLDKPAQGIVAVLAKNDQGYHNLFHLSHLFSACQDTIPLSQLHGAHEGLILLTGGCDGPLHKLVGEGRLQEASEVLKIWHRLFQDRLYIELQRHGHPLEENVEPFLLEQALAHHIPVVATHEPYFVDASFYEAHDALWAIAQGSMVDDQTRKRLTPKHYFTSQEEMAALFADIPEAIENTGEIARRIAFRPLPRPPLLPKFSSDKEDPLLLRQKAQEGLTARLKTVREGASLYDYESRLAYELDVITSMNFSGYFLIVSDFIVWAKKQHIPVGPGRGSGAGSLVAWCLYITELDPLRFGLLFERFLNPERISLPDFDIDFCQERRDEVIDYVRQKYGQERVAHIITFGKLQARAVLRDVGRVLGMPYSQVDRICKLVPFNPTHPLTLQEGINSEPRLQQERDNDPMIARLIEVSLKLEGLYRHASVHAAGVVIGDRPLKELIPLYQDPRSGLISTQFNMKWVEKAGLVKFDFLGLKTLSVIAKTCALLEKKVCLDINTIPLDDAQTFAMLARGETMGIFQLENASMRDVLKKMKADRLEDIIALVALNRPGPMDNIPRYINCKNGIEKVHYMHEKLKFILEETYGIIVYQEQVMQIAQVLSGYRLGDADILRRAMGKKIQEEMDAQRAMFVEGAQKNGVPEKQAVSIFELVNKFAGYGFNKSHAAAYALISYQTAYLKANYPLEFLAAIMTFDMANPEKLALYREEMIRLNVPLFPPHINASEATFVPTCHEITRQPCLYYSLGAIKNVGTQAMEKVVRLRQEGGKFKDIFDLLKRCGKILNKKNLENLIYAGALDCLHAHRAQLIEALDALLKYASSSQESAAFQSEQQMSLFSSHDYALSQPFLPDTPMWTAVQALAFEFQAIGFYLSDHPLNAYKEKLAQTSIITYATFLACRVPSAQLAGVVTQVRLRKSRQGGMYAFVTMSDTTGQFDFIIFGSVFDAIRERLTEGALLFAHMEADWSSLEASASDEDDKEVYKPRLKAIFLKDLKHIFESREDFPDKVQTPPPSVQPIRLLILNEQGLLLLKKCLKGGGHQPVYVQLPPISIDHNVYHVELFLGSSFNTSFLMQALEENQNDILLQKDMS